MSYVKIKEARKAGETNEALVDFGWEVERVPLLHSGFIEATTHDETKSILAIQIYFQNGTYRARVQDREDNIHAFINGSNLESLLDVIEEALRVGSLDWQQTKPFSGHRNGTTFA